LDLATVEDWGEEIFPERVGVNWKKWASGEGEGKDEVPHPPPRLLCTNPLPVKHPRWRHCKLYSLSSFPRQNNACTASYLLAGIREYFALGRG